MATAAQLGSDFQEFIIRYGSTCTVRYWSLGSEVYTAADYDDATLANGSSTVISGGVMVQPLGNTDAVYVAQGLLRQDDVKGYFIGSITIVPNSQVTLGTTGSIYDVLPHGIQRWDYSGVSIYQRVFLRRQLQ